MLPEIHAEPLLIRDISFNIHVEISDEIEVKILFHWSNPRKPVYTKLTMAWTYINT